MKLKLTAEAWLKIGTETGWLKKEAADVDSQFAAIRGKNVPALPDTPANSNVKQQYTFIATEKQWFDVFVQSMSNVSKTITDNLTAMQRMPSKNQFILGFENQLRQLQNEITVMAQTIPAAQKYYMSTMQALESTVTQSEAKARANQSGVYPTGTSNIPLGGAPAIPTM